MQIKYKMKPILAVFMVVLSGLGSTAGVKITQMTSEDSRCGPTSLYYPRITLEEAEIKETDKPLVQNMTSSNLTGLNLLQNQQNATVQISSKELFEELDRNFLLGVLVSSLVFLLCVLVCCAARVMMKNKNPE